MVGVDFLDKYHFLSLHKHDNAVSIYKDREYQCTGYKKKYLLMIEERISDNIEYNYYEFPLDYEDDGSYVRVLPKKKTEIQFLVSWLGFSVDCDS